jgi:hypothetical protein
LSASVTVAESCTSAPTESAAGSAVIAATFGRFTPHAVAVTTTVAGLLARIPFETTSCTT